VLPPTVPGKQLTDTDPVNDFALADSGANCPADSNHTCYNTAYNFAVTATSTTRTETGISNVAAGIVKHLFISGPTVSQPYGTPIPQLTPTTAGLDPGLTGSTSCTTTATQFSPLGVYPVTCSGQSPATGVTYLPGSLTITRPIVTPSVTAANKFFDGTNSATITSCSLTGVQAADAPNVSCSAASATFSSPHAGTWTVTATGIALGGPSAANYTLSSNTATTTATIFPAPQTITFNPIAAQIYGNPPFAVNASASSGLPVSFAASGSCALSGNTVTLTAAGDCSVTASQAGNGDYQAAIPVTQAFHIFGFVATGSLTTPRSSQTATLLGNGQVLVAGGLSGSAQSSALKTVELYASGSFKATGSLATARSSHTATLLGGSSANAGKVLVVGGFDGSGSPLASAELFNPVTGTFSSTANNMPNKAAGHTATWIPTINRVLVVGGGNASSQLYDPATNKWNAGGGIANQVSFHTATWIPSIGKVLIAGGSGNNGSTSNAALLYDPSTGSFANTGNMTVSRDYHTAVLLTSGPNSGKVLIAGGRSGSSKAYTYLSSAELYDPVTGTFTATGSMASARQYFTAMYFSGTTANPLATPTFVEAGGISGTAAAQTRLSSTEQYPASSFGTFASMTAPRAAHTATALADGTVLVVGGQGSNGAATATAEVLQ